MGDLHVCVRWQGRVIEDRVLPVRDAVRIGDEPGAAVPFPGASLLVERVGEDLATRGHVLAEGERTRLSLGAVTVDVEHLECARPAPLRAPPLDLRFAFVALGVLVGSMWVDAVSAQLAHRGLRPGQVAARVVRAERPTAEAGQTATVALGRGSAADLAPPVAVEGREATPDDAETGWAYYAWYRQAVPSTLDARIASLQLAQDPRDSELKGLAARGAYDNDDWRQALGLYTELVQAQPQDLRWLNGLGLAQKRLGMHRAELLTWGRVLELEPEDIAARGHRAVALARLGDYDAANGELDLLRTTHGEHPYAAVVEGLILATLGQEDAAVAALDQAFFRQGQLPQALQLELRRDLALDPALRVLRSDRELRVMLYRHLGAAAPRPYR